MITHHRLRYRRTNTAMAGRRFTVARKDTIEFTWHRNVACRALGHRPVARPLVLSGRDYVECARCGRRPLWWGTLAAAKTHAHPALARTDYYTRPQWVGFRSWDAFMRHIASGGQVRWPGDPDVEGMREADDQTMVEQVTVGTYFRATVRAPRAVAASLAWDTGTGIRSAFEGHVTVGPAQVIVTTNLLGRGVARRLIPAGQTRRVAVAVRLGPPGRTVTGTEFRTEVWVDDFGPLEHLPRWRHLYARPFSRNRTLEAA